MVSNTPYEAIALKGVHVMQALLLQEPRENQANRHFYKFSRLSLWNGRRIYKLLYEGQTMQNRLKACETIQASPSYERKNSI